MKRILRQRWALGTGFMLVALAAGSIAASAGTTTLNCSWANARSHAGNSNIILDEGANTITVYYSPTPNPGGSPDPIPGGLKGTYAAKFTPDEISFVDEEGNKRTLNRSTGVLEWYGTAMHPIGDTETCHVAQKQF